MGMLLGITAAYSLYPSLELIYYSSELWTKVKEGMKEGRKRGHKSMEENVNT